MCTESAVLGVERRAAVCELFARGSLIFVLIDENVAVVVEISKTRVVEFEWCEKEYRVYVGVEVNGFIKL